MGIGARTVEEEGALHIRRGVDNGQDIPRPSRAVIVMPGMDERRHGWHRGLRQGYTSGVLRRPRFPENGETRATEKKVAKPEAKARSRDEREPLHSNHRRTTSASHWLDGGETAPAPREHVNTASSTEDAPFDSGTSLALRWSDFALFPAFAHASVPVLRENVSKGGCAARILEEQVLEQVQWP
ncbi:hypothetical protein FB451DRAFT_1365175 [Mycena latifolia]|nr:hypothetical protein FB451DRAFT_1365175 [Mycena latifolia]